MVKSQKLIGKEGIIKAGEDGYVYVEKSKLNIKNDIVKGRPSAKAKELGLSPWQKGNAGVDFDVNPSELKTGINPVTKGTDLRIKGNINLKERSPEYFRRKK